MLIGASDGFNSPIMFFTAMNRPVDRENAKAAGASEYLCKPDYLDVFVDSVTRLLRRSLPVYMKNTRFRSLGEAA